MSSHNKNSVKIFIKIQETNATGLHDKTCCVCCQLAVNIAHICCRIFSNCSQFVLCMYASELVLCFRTICTVNHHFRICYKDISSSSSSSSGQNMAAEQNHGPWPTFMTTPNTGTVQTAFHDYLDLLKCLRPWTERKKYTLNASSKLCPCTKDLNSHDTHHPGQMKPIPDSRGVSRCTMLVR